MTTALPLGWFVPVSPGTRQVTVGGAIAADVHGKNHHRAGSFARHVRSFDLLMADGEVRVLTPADSPELFWATAGGMGLTGIILRATIAAGQGRDGPRPWSTPCAPPTSTRRWPAWPAADRSHGYTVAWADCLARGGALGRSVVTSGDFAAVSDLPAGQRGDPLRFSPASLASAPPVFPNGLINSPHGRADERGLVPQGAAAPDRRAADDRRVLPPAGRHQELEPGLRARRLPAVPVRRAVRPGGRRPQVVRADQPGPRAVVRDRAEALRPRRSRPAVVPGAGLDPGARLPGPHAGPGQPAGRARRPGARRRRPGLPGQGRPRAGPACWPRCTRGSASSASCRAEIDPGGVFVSDLARRLSL